MKNLIKSKIFIGTFLLTYFLFFIVTVFILDLKIDGFGVGHIAYGFPFTYYYSHCFGGDYIWSGLLENIFVAMVISFITALIVPYLGLNISSAIRAKLSSPEFRARWYLDR